jgi:hypothetical protein
MTADVALIELAGVGPLVSEVIERCGEDAVLHLESEGVAIEQPAIYGTAPVILRTDLFESKPKAEFSLKVSIRPMDEDEFTELIVKSTNLEYSAECKTLVVAACAIHCMAQTKLNDKDFSKLMWWIGEITSQYVNRYLVS